MLWACREPSLGRHVRRELLRHVWRDFTPLKDPQLLITKAIMSRHTVGLLDSGVFDSHVAREGWS